MQPIQTLDEFFTRSGAEVSLYHMGRHVVACPRESLAAFERGELAWPEPWQGQARLAILFRLGDMPEPAIWFLALPLDEQGILAPAQRDAFLNRLLETLGRAVSQVGREETADVDHLMKDNPLAFTPSITFQAMLNARGTYDVGLPASQHFEPVEDYLSGQQAIDWQALGLQGIADYVVRMESPDADTLALRLPDLPTAVINSVCYCLEHQPLPQALVAALEDAERLPLFLQRLAEDERTDFAAVVRDLALIPRLRLPVMMAMRDAPEGSSIQHRLSMMMSQRKA